ncbi:MAG: hypothetical protein WC438_01880 [Candidatus Pacearchaeota archaeon]
MQVIGFNLLKILVEREEKTDEQLNIKQNLNIDEVIKDNVKFSKDDLLKIKFTFTTDYNDGKFAKIEFKGQTILLPEKDELKEILKSWKDKQLPENVRIPLFNFIMGKCNIKTLNLEDEMGLPLHIPMPKITSKKE